MAAGDWVSGSKLRITGLGITTDHTGTLTGASVSYTVVTPSGHEVGPYGFAVALTAAQSTQIQAILTAAVTAVASFEGNLTVTATP